MLPSLPILLCMWMMTKFTNAEQVKLAIIFEAARNAISGVVFLENRNFQLRNLPLLSRRLNFELEKCLQRRDILLLLLFLDALFL